MTALYSLMHLLVDGVCALAMFGSFLLEEEGYFYILVYNFCAFALQMPLGILLDAFNAKTAGRGKRMQADPAFFAAAAGVLCTIVGAVTHPMLLGIGNALFHVGGGVGCIREDHEKKWLGRGLGIFVAPGALGLYIGTLAAKRGNWESWYFLASAAMALLCVGALYVRGHDKKPVQGSELSGQDIPYKPKAAESGMEEPVQGKPGGLSGNVKLAFCCLLVVVLRSYIGMAVTFPWKTGAAAGVAAVLAVAGGKVAGGFGAARYGNRRTAVFSLLPAAFCYLFSGVMPIGLAAIFLFHMTMPLALYWMALNMPEMPGFAFGFLTFALFIGFLPGYFGVLSGGGNVMGCAGCIFSLVLLLLGMGKKGGGAKL